jgi:hypothetical protein
VRRAIIHPDTGFDQPNISGEAKNVVQCPSSAKAHQAARLR